MRKNNIKSLILGIATFFAVGVTGCSSEIKIKPNADGTFQVDFKMDMGTAVFEEIKSIAQGVSELTGAENPATFESMEDFFAVDTLDPSFMGSTKITFPDKTSFKISIEDSESFLGVQLTKNSLSIKIDAMELSDFVENLDEQTAAYIDLLMAPVFSGDEDYILTPEEYIDQIAIIYGNEIATDFKNSTVKITLEAPTGKSIKTSKSSSNYNIQKKSSEATVKIPLASFLTLTHAETFTITW